MKKYLVAFIFFLVIPNISLAVSGACSYHGGVNCSIGASTYGNAVCNDGWESSTLYYQTDECRQTFPSCVASDCSPSLVLEQCLGSVNALAARYGLGGSSEAEVMSVQCEQKAASCQSLISAYNFCLMAKNNYNTYTPPVYDADASCKKRFGQNSIVSPTKNGYCSCQNGYVFGTNNQCVPIPVIIATNFLPDATFNKPYSADINFTYSGKDTPLLRINTFPEGLYFDFININGNNGVFIVKLTPRKLGQFSFSTEIVVNNVSVGTKTFNLSVVDQNQVTAAVNKTTAVIPEPAPVVIEKQNDMPAKIEIQKPASKKPEPKKEIKKPENIPPIVATSSVFVQEAVSTNSIPSPVTEVKKENLFQRIWKKFTSWF